MSDNRKRHFSMVFYGSNEELTNIIHKYHARIAHYAYILHDKDVYLEERKNEKGEVVNAVGDIEKPHFHVLVSLFNACSKNALKRLFTTENDKPQVQEVTDMVMCYRYLTHKDDSDKYQYPSTDIVADDINYFEKMCIVGQKKDSDNIAASIIEDILKGISPRLMVDRYGRDFVIHMKQYQECAQAIKEYDYDQAIRKKAEEMKWEPLQESVFD